MSKTLKQISTMRKTLKQMGDAMWSRVWIEQEVSQIEAAHLLDLTQAEQDAWVRTADELPPFNTIILIGDWDMMQTAMYYKPTSPLNEILPTEPRWMSEGTPLSATPPFWRHMPAFPPTE